MGQGNETSHSFHIHSKDPHSYQNVSRWRLSSPGNTLSLSGNMFLAYFITKYYLYNCLENQDYKGTHHIEHKMPQHVDVTRVSVMNIAHDPLVEEMCCCCKGASVDLTSDLCRQV